MIVYLLVGALSLAIGFLMAQRQLNAGLALSARRLVTFVATGFVLLAWVLAGWFDEGRHVMVALFATIATFLLGFGCGASTAKALKA